MEEQNEIAIAIKKSKTYVDSLFNVMTICRIYDDQIQSDQRTTTPIFFLPRDIIVHTFLTYLSHNEIAKCSGVCKSWYDLVTKFLSTFWSEYYQSFGYKVGIRKYFNVNWLQMVRFLPAEITTLGRSCVEKT
jgi:hypothetical protein